jgi:hypothetical protein
LTARRRPSAWPSPAGTVSNTGIARPTLGRGLGWLMGKHGLAVDNLLSAGVSQHKMADAGPRTMTQTR